ncbi:MAG TPA: mercuric reductase, partial [Synergistales bacterium]|nr:mercuric reductase [Synergistales bacterium]
MPFPEIPEDRYKEDLLFNVSPPGWINPKPAGEYDLAVIGAGSAGLVAAIGAAKLGARTALIEKSLLGGDCLNYGCVPSKLLIRSGRAAREIGNSEDLGIRVSSYGIQFPKVMERLRRVRTRISEHDSAERLTREGVDVFFGEACFASPSSILLGEQRIRFSKAIIATGAKAMIPDIEGLEEAGYLTNETIFNLQELPRTLMVLGGGPLGCELAQAFRRLGSRVFILQRGEQFLKREDPDAASMIARVFREEGIEVLFSSLLNKVSVEKGIKRAHVASGEKERMLEVDHILVALGRVPEIESLGLEAAEVEYDRKEGIRVNDNLRSSNPRIYAAGDCCLSLKFTHMADASARIALQNALFGGRRKVSSLNVPWCTYTDPEVAHVGMYEWEASEKGLDFETLSIPLKELDRALL